MRGLVKFRGMLCIAEFVPSSSDKGGCPRCHSPASEYLGWWECDNCGFAVSMSDLNKMRESILLQTKEDQ